MPLADGVILEARLAGGRKAEDTGRWKVVVSREFDLQSSA